MFEKAEQTYFRCAGCGVQFAVSKSVNANLARTFEEYEPAYRQYLDSTATDRDNLDAVIRWIERYVQLDGRVRLLDVGVGSGKFLRRLSATRSCQLTGLEPSEALFRAYRLGDLGVVPSSLPQFVDTHANQFDVVTVLDVIEHVPDAREFIDALRRVVKPGGRVFVSTPDTAGPLARVLGRRWHHYNAYHYTLYNPNALAAAASASGFITIESRHYAKKVNLGYVWNYAADFLWRGAFGGVAESRFSLSVNLRDILWAVWLKRGTDAGDRETGQRDQT
jgi:2-polyprenyl-3-methyl-5-hydroxy-6-metoxy-1,4-benzoquinol methylase